MICVLETTNKWGFINSGRLPRGSYDKITEEKQKQSPNVTIFS